MQAQVLGMSLAGEAPNMQASKNSSALAGAVNESSAAAPNIARQKAFMNLPNDKYPNNTVIFVP